MDNINPDLQLDAPERAQLVQITLLPGFPILQRLMRSEVDRFVLSMINADPSKPKEVLARQVLAKAAAQFYQAVINRVNEERTQYLNIPKPDEKPVDATAELLDLGTLASELNDETLGGEDE